MNTAIVGVNWGDEGKGRMVDLLSGEYDYVVRYQGGNNAGHTVVNDKGEFKLNLLPSGIFRENTINVMGSGMVVDLKHLYNEIADLRSKGIVITPENLKVSDKAVICMPYHVVQDGLEEGRLGDMKYGSTQRGIAPVYGDKYLKKTMKMGDIIDGIDYSERLKSLVDYKNMIFKAYGAEEISYDEMKEWLEKYGSFAGQFVTDTGKVLREAEKQGKKILFEAQLGALRDVDYGIYPFTSSSNSIAAYAPIGCGAPSLKVDSVVGIVKAYSSCVGEGAFVSEMFGEEAETLRKAGGEYGAATGRPRRVGAFDIPATRYGVQVQGATEIALTKIDVLSIFDKIPVCTKYELNGKIIEDFPYPGLADACKSVIEYVPGWKCDISHARKWDDLPKEAQDYINLIEENIGCKITYVSVGAKREEYLVK